jgi:hypothetical protein
LPRVDRAPAFEAERREIASGWRAALLDDDVTIIERLHLAAANHADAEILEFRRDD